MATLTIKNIPEPLVRKLKNQAEVHRRSLNHEVIQCLEQAAGSVPLNPESLIAHARTIRKSPTTTRLTDRTLQKLRTEGRP
ncbi:MAG: hypothetical protein NPIRA01_05220 [Nitrospirales bacterium]|nr:MAG: hypothetical protein NPIRA01_05220 [Nitrospirales bacterium]